MGSWYLEAGKMVLYILIPVGAFHFFNQPDIFREWIAEARVRTTPVLSDGTHEKILQMKREHRRAINKKQNLETNEVPM